MPLDKVRIRFCKSGELRLVSHHDLMRTWERMLRRAQLPFRMTEGFHPTPRLIFALSLSLGIVGSREVVELELTETIPPDEILARLTAQAPQGLHFLNIRRIPIKQTAQPRRAFYRIDTSAWLQQHQISPETWSHRCEQLLQAPELWVIRTHPKPREIDIRPYLDHCRVVDGQLEVTLWITGEGTARIEEVASLFDLPNPVVHGLLVERFDLEIADEISETEAQRVPPSGPIKSRPVPPSFQSLERFAERANENKKDPATASWGASPNGPVVE